MGSVEHGTRIIKQYANFIKEFPRFHFAFKLQYRDLETFIRQDFKNRTDVKLINRFEETKLTREGQKIFGFGNEKILASLRCARPLTSALWTQLLKMSLTF